ncbi:MAG: class I SAM-dependent methyltransferase [Xenococcaceae cyanobacterium]
MMEVNVSNFILKSPAMLAYPEQEDYTYTNCPICNRDDESFLLADVRCQELTSIETAFCKRCEHLYLRKLPSVQWYQRYYATEWDTGRTASINSSANPLARFKRVLKKLPLTQVSLRIIKRHLLKNSRKTKSPLFNPDISVNRGAMEILSFLFGVAESDGVYYLAKPDINKVLEVGCGHGYVLEVFHRRGFSAFGTEASAYRAKSCRERGLNVFDCPVDSFKPIEHLGPFDLVYSTQVLEHIATPEKHIKQLSDLIKKEGYLYIQVPYLMHEVNLIHRCHSPVHCHSFSPRSLSLLLEKYGFTPIAMKVDINLQILARKVPPDGRSFGGLPTPISTAKPTQLLDIFKFLSEEQGKSLRFTWDHAFFQIKQVQDERVLYTREMNFNVARQPVAHSMDISFRYNQDEPLFPIHFNHPGEVPPIYTKKN